MSERPKFTVRLPLESFMEGSTDVWDVYKLDVLVGNMERGVDCCYDCGTPFCVGDHKKVYQYVFEETIKGSICARCYKVRMMKHEALKSILPGGVK